MYLASKIFRMETNVIRLGLIGDNIRQSKSPLLHRLSGQLTDLDVTYETLIPADQKRGFDDLFDWCASSGFRGINVTFPYKERVVSRLNIECPTVRALGACNTVIFGQGRPKGYNTDYSGFCAAFRQAFPDTPPGHVAMAGAGGVGKAVAFGLADLGAKSITLFDPSVERAQALADALAAFAPQIEVTLASDIESACAFAQGLVNSTPLGMDGYPGSAFPPHLLAGKQWVFDAVYTPVETQFLKEAKDAGVAILSGYELFFHQGIDAFRLFTGREVDQNALRSQLLAPA